MYVVGLGLGLGLGLGAMFTTLLAGIIYSLPMSMSTPFIRPVNNNGHNAETIYQQRI